MGSGRREAGAGSPEGPVAVAITTRDRWGRGWDLGEEPEGGAGRSRETARVGLNLPRAAGPELGLRND